MNDKTEYSKMAYGIGFVAIAVLFVIALLYGANFQLRQSVIVALILAWLATYAEGFKRDLETRIDNSVEKPVYKFLPYSVRIDPKWEQILLDFHLIGSLAEWESMKKDVWGDLPHGFAFTVLRYSEDSDEMLVYQASEQNVLPFESDVEVCRKIKIIEFKENRFFHLRVFVERTGSGYELGIIVPEEWWEGVKANCPHPVRESSGNEFYQVKLILALIPEAEFAWYLRPEQRIGPGHISKADPQRYVYEEWRKQIASSQQEERTRWGWSRSELYEGGPEIIENSYFTLRHETI